MQSRRFSYSKVWITYKITRITKHNWTACYTEIDRLRDSSIFILRLLDKGELQRDPGALLKDRGYRIRVLDRMYPKFL